MKKRTLKSKILDYVEMMHNAATYTQITRFAHDHKYGAKDWAKNPNRRGHFSDALAGQWIYDRPDQHHYAERPGYLVKRGVKSGWLQKNPDGTYRTVRYVES